MRRKENKRFSHLMLLSVNHPKIYKTQNPRQRSLRTPLCVPSLFPLSTLYPILKIDARLDEPASETDSSRGLLIFGAYISHLVLNGMAFAQVSERKEILVYREISFSVFPDDFKRVRSFMLFSVIGYNYRDF